jgi:hypothetical protein
MRAPTIAWSIAGEESIPMTERPVACATGMATRPFPVDFD